MFRTALLVTLGSVLAFLQPAVPAADPPAPAAKSSVPDPLRLVPAQADLMLKIEQPGKLLKIADELYGWKELQGFSAYREFLDSTNVRRFQHLLAYFEKQLGKPYPELLDQLAGGGIVLAVKFSEQQPPPVMLVVQGKDPALTKKFATMLWDIAQQELARLESKQQPKRDTYRDVEVFRIGDDLQAAVLDAAIVVSTVPKGLEAAIDLHLDKANQKSLLHVADVREAKKLLPADPLVWAWVNLEPVKASGAGVLFKLPAEVETAPFFVLFGGWLDVARRSPFLTAALAQDKDSYLLSIRMPKGTEGMHEGVRGHVPPEGRNGALPLLEPKGVIHSSSYYLDLRAVWEARDKLLTEAGLKALEQLDKQSGTFLLGASVSKLLGHVGERQRLVVARQFETGYDAVPQTPLPGFALVVELRDPEAFAKAIEPPIRSAALLGSFGAEMKLVEENRGDAKIIGYRFLENAKNKDLNHGLLFNFSPCFVRVGNQMVFSSTLELARNLVDLLEKEAKAPVPKEDAAARSRFTWAGLAGYLDSLRDTLITQEILASGSSPEEARNEIKLLLELVQKLGTVELSNHYEPNRFRYDFRFKLTGFQSAN